MKLSEKIDFSKFEIIKEWEQKGTLIPVEFNYIQFKSKKHNYTLSYCKMLKNFVISEWVQNPDDIIWMKQYPSLNSIRAKINELAEKEE